VPGLNEDQVRHAESITHGIVKEYMTEHAKTSAERWSQMEKGMAAMEERLTTAIAEPRQCEDHPCLALAVDRNTVALKEIAGRRSRLPTWLSIIISLSFGIPSVVWTVTQFVHFVKQP
jgi:hypothetical protein